MYILGKTLLETDAKTWLYIIEQDNLGPLDDWTKMKRLLIQTFKPANSSIILRDKLHQLKQKPSISEYIREFVQLKISITNLSNEEAVSQFVRGLKDSDLRLKIHRLYRGDNCPPLNEAINEAYLHESSAQAIIYHPSDKVEKNEPVDDPMDLSAALHKILAIVSPDEKNNQYNRYNNNQFRSRGNGGNYRGRGNFRGRGGARGKQCFACKGYGHVQVQCPNYKKKQKVYYLDNAEDFDDNDNDYNDENGENNFINNKNEQKSYEHYSDTSSFLLYSVLPSSSSYIQPLTITKEILQDDIDFILNAAVVQYKLPLYTITINGNKFKYSVLIDSGASANYINSRVLHDITDIKNIQTQSVETANGQRSEITAKARFNIQMNEYQCCIYIIYSSLHNYI
jgi:hypothetical protein